MKKIEWIFAAVMLAVLVWQGVCWLKKSPAAAKIAGFLRDCVSALL